MHVVGMVTEGLAAVHTLVGDEVGQSAEEATADTAFNDELTLFKHEQANL